MTTANLLIAWPEVQELCTEYTSFSTAPGTNSPNETDNKRVYNSMGGKRPHYWQSGGAYSEHNIVYDMGPDALADCDFFCLSSLRYLKETVAARQVKFELQRSADNSAYTVEQSIADISAATLIGPWANDYIQTFSTTGSYRYWKARLAKTASTDFAAVIGKIYFGQFLDLLQDPFDYEINRYSPGDAEFISDAGAPWAVRMELPQYQFTFRWKNLRTTEVSAFYRNIYLKKHRNPIFLYTSSYHALLDEQRLVHCRLIEAGTDNRFDVADRHYLEARFVEVHG